VLFKLAETVTMGHLTIPEMFWDFI